MPRMKFVLVCDASKSWYRVIHDQFDNEPRVNEIVERDLLTGTKTWFVVKVYNPETQQRLEALATLMGFEAIQQILDFDAM